MVIHVPNRHHNHRADDDRAVVVMDMIGVSMWIVAMPTDMEANMHAMMPAMPPVVPVVPVMVPVVPPVMPDMASVAPVGPVMAIMLLVVIGTVSRVPLDVLARSRM